MTPSPVDEAWRQKQHEAGNDCGQLGCKQCEDAAIEWVKNAPPLTDHERELLEDVRRRLFGDFE